MLPECSGRHWGSTLAHLFHPATNIVGASGEKGLNRDLINRNPSLWEVRNHTLLPANTLTKVSWRDLPVPNFNSTAAKDTETHPHGPLGTHTPPVSSSPGWTLTHTHTHTHTRTPGSDRRINSQDLQVTQRSEGSIFNAADVVVVQLPVEKQGESMKGWAGAVREPAGRPRSPSTGPSTLAALLARQELVQSQPVCHAAVSPLWLSEGTTQTSAPKAVRSQ